MVCGECFGCVARAGQQIGQDNRDSGSAWETLDVGQRQLDGHAATEAKPKNEDGTAGT